MAAQPATGMLADGPGRVRIEGERLARASGRRVCGYVSASAPVEMIEAAGFLPVEITGVGVGLGGSGTPNADTLMETLFHPVVRRIFEAAMTGGLDWLDAIVLPRSSDAPHRLYYYLCELQRTGGKGPSPLLFDITQTPGGPSEAYSLERMEHLWSQLRAMGRGGAGEAELTAAIAGSNARRALLERLARMRREHPGTISGTEALAAFAASRMLPGDLFEAEVEALLARPPGRGMPGSPRIVVAGSPQEGAELAGLIEASGGVVVGDFHGAGELSAGEAVASDATPLVALTAAWRASLAGNRAFGDPAEAIVRFAREAGAQGVVFSYLPEEEALTWDYPAQAAALSAAGIAVIRLGDQATPFDADAARPVVEPFVQSLKTGASS